MTDDQIALALEMYHGQLLPWKAIGKHFGMDHRKLYQRVYRALHRGMRT